MFRTNSGPFFSRRPNLNLVNFSSDPKLSSPIHQPFFDLSFDVLMFQEWVHEHDAGVAAAGGGEHGAPGGGQGPRLN